MNGHTLIVEDDPDSRRVLGMLLRMRGYEIDSAATLGEAEQKLRWQKPDFIILDLMLPDGSGLTLLKKMRDANSPIKVAVTTAVHDHSILNKMHQLEPDAYFPKPIDMAALTKWLQSTAA